MKQPPKNYSNRKEEKQLLKSNLANPRSFNSATPENIAGPDAESQYEDQREFEDFEAALTDAQKAARQKKLFAFMDAQTVVTPRKIKHN